MPASPWFRLDDGTTSAGPTLHLIGAWRLADLARIEAALDEVTLPPTLTVDAGALTGVDSASALVLVRRLSGRGDVAWIGLDAAQARIVEQARAYAATAQAPPAPAPRPSTLSQLGQ